MGRQLFENNETFRRWMLLLDEIAQGSLKRSVPEVLYSRERGQGDAFTRTLLTHPAIFMVEYSLGRTLIEQGVQPDMVLGASLGSFAAAAIGGFIAVEDALRAVIRQAEAIEDSCPPGGMTAVMGANVSLAQEFLTADCELAAINFSSHFVLSGIEDELARVEASLSRRGIAYQRLPVSVAFHSQGIEPAQASFELFMRPMSCRRGQVPLVCCNEASVVSNLPDGFFWNAVRRPIRFSETFSRLEQQGAYRYIDVGPASTLATFLKYGLAKNTKSSVHPILSPFGCDQKNLGAVRESSQAIPASSLQ